MTSDGGGVGGALALSHHTGSSTERAKLNKRTSTPIRVIGELLVIMLGVLLALWAEDWRANASDRRQTVQYLEQLSSEIDEATPQLVQSIELDSVSEARAMELGPVLRSTESTVPPDSARTLVYFRYSNYQPVLPTLDAILNSRDLRLISSEALRIRMRSTATQLRITESSLERTRSSLNRISGEMYVAVEPLWRRTAHRTDALIPTRLNPILRDTDIQLLRESPTVASLFSYYTAQLNDGSDSKKTLLQSIAELADALDAELGRSP